VPSLTNFFLVFCSKSLSILSEHCTKGIICAWRSTSCFRTTCFTCLHEMSVNTFISIYLQCWWIPIDSLSPLQCLILLPLWVLCESHVDLPTYEHVFATNSTCDCSLICALAHNCTPICNHFCILTYKYVLACIFSCEFLPTFEHVLICEKFQRNDTITPKLHKTGYMYVVM
jgi:hypothetical protein